MLNNLPPTKIIGHQSDPRLLALRIGLLAGGMLFFDVGFGLWEQGQAFVSPVNGLLSILAWSAGALTMVLAVSISSHRGWAWLVLFSMIAFGLNLYYLNAQNATPLTIDRTDNEMIGKYAVEALKHGQNPYSWNFSDILRVYENVGATRTPFLDGSYQNRLTYPALPTLVLWAFDRIGLGQIRIVNLIFYILLLVLIFLSAPRSLRPVILLPLAAIKIFSEMALSGVQDVVWSALLVAMILAWRRPLWRAVFFGLAVSFHQQPWFMAPFLVIALWQAGGTAIDRLRRIALFVGMSGGIFLVCNLPFMLGDFTGWWLGVFEPAYAIFNVYSQGLGFVSMVGIALLPREFFTLLQVSFLGCALWLYWRHPRTLSTAIWIVPGLFFWLYYRGLANYWLFWIPPLLVALMRNGVLQNVTLFSGKHAPDANPTRPSNLSSGIRAVARLRASHIFTAIPIALVMAINAGVGLHYLTAPSPILITRHLPFLTINGGGWIGQMDIDVTNESDTVFRPRFAAQTEPGGQALPWTILSGPENLAPGESGAYTISADGILSKAIPVNQSVQLIVSDARGHYNLRALLTIPPQSDPANIDPIVNPMFMDWPIDSAEPQSWTVQSPPQTQLDMAIETVSGRDALTLTSQGIPDGSRLIPVKLIQIVAFPRQFSLWVYPPDGMTRPLTEAYGVEIDDSLHKLWIVFGGDRNQIAIDPGGPTVAYIAAPSNVWTLQSVDLFALYTQLGWSLPPFSTRTHNGIVYQARQVQFSLIAGSTVQIETTWHFGGIEQVTGISDFNQVISDVLDQPDVYYTNLFKRYLDQGNVDLAAQTWLKAIFARLAAIISKLGI